MKADLPTIWEQRVPTLTVCNIDTTQDKYGDVSKKVADLNIYTKDQVRDVHPE